MKGLVIRDAGPRDSARLAVLAGQLGYPCTEEAVAPRIARFVGLPGCRLVVAELDGLIVGWEALELSRHFYSPPFAEITGLVVDEAFRSRGIGRALLDEARSWASGNGAPILRLKTNALRKDAHRFYEANGFRKVKEQYTYAIELGS